MFDAPGTLFDGWAAAGGTMVPLSSATWGFAWCMQWFRLVSGKRSPHLASLHVQTAVSASNGW